MENIEIKLEKWKNKLLDMGKRNKLINFKESKRGALKIITPSIENLFEELVKNEKTLSFPVATNEWVENEEELKIIPGELETNRTIIEQQKTLGSLRSKARIAKEEQGINILYLCFGFLKWYETSKPTNELISPIILVPIKISIESLTDPYKLCLDEEEVIVNPTLLFKLENDFGITLPSFNSDDDNIVDYLNVIKMQFQDTNWTVNLECSVGLFSFLKVNMYKDMERNIDNIKVHPIIRAIAGEPGCKIEAPVGLHNYNHDKETKPIDLYQVVDADSSQQDAILYAKKGCSFVLQGPPGTGKSQTITNIIAESLADGKKVLFVSEKMAALEVVFARLASVGLSDFCLTLHSYKANKKEVISQLYKMLNYDKVKLQGEALEELTKLELERNSLNEYDEELHKLRSPINMSVYDINGKLSELKSMPSLVFDLKDIQKITKEQRNKYEYYIEAFSKTLGLMKDDFESNPWRNCNVDSVTNELRHDIEMYLKRLNPKLIGLNKIIEKHSLKLGLNNQYSFNSIEDLISMLKITEKSPLIPLNWLDDVSIKKITEEVIMLKDTKVQYLSLLQDLRSRHSVEYLKYQGKIEQDKLVFAVNDTKEILREKDSENNIIVNLSCYIELFKKIIVDLELLNQVSSKIEDLLELNEINNLTNVYKVSELINLIVKRPMPTEMWFDNEKLIVVENELANVKKRHEEILENMQILKGEYELNILNIDYQTILSRFKVDYKSISKIFKKSYKEDKKLIISNLIDFKRKLSDDEIIKTLGVIKTIKENEKTLYENSNSIESILGKRYISEHTKWNDIEDSINIFKSIKYWFRGKSIPNKIKEVLLTERYSDDIEELKKNIDNLIKTNNISHVNKSFLLSNDINEKNIVELKNKANNFLNKLEKINEEYSNVTKFDLNKFTFNQVNSDLENLEKLQQIEKTFEINEETLKKELQYLYNGLDTDFENILNMLSWTSIFKEEIIKNNLSEKFVENVCTNGEFINDISSSLEEITESYKECSLDMRWILNLFSYKNEISDEKIERVINRFEQCLNNLVSLEYWIDYRSSRENCRKVGLGDFIEKVEENKLKSNIVMGVFRKRFYRLLLDSIIDENDVLKSFRRRIQDDRIINFRKLDKEQFKIANVRIKERLINQLPNTNMFTSAMDEVGILKREHNKQRRIMPLRQLFKNIPNLILKLKPCLMMSPLSVSLFLESENFEFDVVIFDEGSQVCTENAIGAIYRGKQVIIAGDSKQLPPTNFFSRNTTDSEYNDNDEEEDYYNDSEGYESVLDEALTALPERTLMWHYRSKHEHLITFSNVKIYGGELTTFPSNVDKVPDNGVEYIYVENGIYERGGKKCNSVEAKKVAELVFEHMSKYPNRSLGVVTFSEAQQDAVNVALKKKRMENPRFERFFNEDKETPFFVKNLENVQGDERDTIIFSIGYGKDINGKMYMNFGPISRSGGYRRLNVAITRAKYNIKLVGSILPTDIDTEKSSLDGVKMLRSYIEFAMQGPKSLAGEITVQESIQLESPFEESVYSFLVSHGYDVSSQVGCSGYRIDLAVKHPKLNGVYVLAVECDGATYHSARTARERDRLRQTVLEDIGWRVYRIWSLDWIKDPITEGERLLQAVETAIAEYGSLECNDRNECVMENINLNDKINENNYLKTVVEERNNAFEYGFELYEEADISKVYRNPDDLIYVKEVILEIVKNEQPVHFELLCRRIAYLFGNQKVTVKIRDYANNVIKRLLDKQVEVIDNFCWIKSDKEVTVRVPNEEFPFIRPINFISKEEIAEAMKVIVMNSIGISKNSLFNIVGKIFGFSRLGPQIMKALEDSYGFLIDAVIIEEIEEKVRLKESMS